MPSKTEASKQKEKTQAERKGPEKSKAVAAKTIGKKTDRKKAGQKIEKKSEKPLKVPTAPQLRHEGKAEILSSAVAYEGPLFKLFKEEVREPNGHVTNRDVIRHNGSVVILAVDTRGKKRKDDPLVIMERQYRHAAGQYLWELPAGKIEPGEERLAGAKRELAEETGYAAGTWTELVRYFASPGFLGEWMQVYLAEDLTAGTATPEADETLEIYPLPLSEVEELIAAGQILDGKTLIGIVLYRQLRTTRDRANKKKKKAHSKNG